MAPKIFLTGVTGYIGGSVFDNIYNAHPDWDYTLLVRNAQRQQVVESKYPNVKFVHGDLGDEAVFEKAASKADVVVHTADSADSVVAARGIAKGLAASHSAGKPGYWIHVSGTAILTWHGVEHKRFGEAPLAEQTYDDIKDIDRITSLPDSALHRNVDKIVLAANSDAVKTAVVCPPLIYGVGTGVGNKRSIQVPDIIKNTLKKGVIPYVGAGLSEWDNVHIDDLGVMIRNVVEATQDNDKNGDAEIFGPRAYYFVASGRHNWADVARKAADEAIRQGYLPETAVARSMSQQDMMGMEGVGMPSMGTNSSGVASRARKMLGWEAKGPSLGETLGEAVRREADALGLKNVSA